MILGSRREGQGGHPPWPLLSGGAAQWAVMRLEWHKPRGQKVKDSREHMFGFECAVRSFTKLLLLLLLSCFSRVRLCETPQTTANQAPPSLGFSRQEHWSGLPFPSPISESEVTQLCPTPSDPMDCSPPGSAIHGIFQARVLEWGAIALLCYKTRELQMN